MTPSGTAISTDRAMVVVASATVGPMRSAIRAATCFLKKNDSPKSPVSTCPIQTKNCATIERSSPRRARMSTMSCEVAAAPAMMAAGSPGVSRSIENTSTATIAMTGIVASKRRAM
jgi:hypothetical protein